MYTRVMVRVKGSEFGVQAMRWSRGRSSLQLAAKLVAQLNVCIISSCTWFGLYTAELSLDYIQLNYSSENDSADGSVKLSDLRYEFSV